MAYKGAEAYISVKVKEAPVKTDTPARTGYQGVEKYMPGAVKSTSGYRGASSYGAFSGTSTQIGSFSPAQTLPEPVQEQAPQPEQTIERPSFFKRLMSSYANIGRGIADYFTGTETITLERTPEGISVTPPPAPEKTFGEKAKELFTGNTSETMYDVFYQQAEDRQILEAVNEYTKSIGELVRRNREEQDAEKKRIREEKIRTLLDAQQKLASTAGGTIKDKTTKQLIGQSLGTAIELAQGIPIAGGGIGIIMAEGGIYGGAMMASESMKRNAPAEDIVAETSLGIPLGALGAGLLSAILSKLGSKGITLIRRLRSKEVLPEEIATIMEKEGIQGVEEKLDELATREISQDISEQQLINYARREADNGLEVIPVEGFANGATIRSVVDTASGRTSIYVTPETTTGDLAKEVAKYIYERNPKIATTAAKEIKELTGGIGSPVDDFADAVKRITASMEAKNASPTLVEELQKIGLDLGARTRVAERTAVRSKTISREKGKAPVEKKPTKSPVSKEGTVYIKDPEVEKLLNDSSDFGRVFQMYYERALSDMKRGAFSPPISGANKGKNVVDEGLAKKWALDSTITMSPDSLKKMANKIKHNLTKSQLTDTLKKAQELPKPPVSKKKTLKKSSKKPQASMVSEAPQKSVSKSIPKRVPTTDEKFKKKLKEFSAVEPEKNDVGTFAKLAKKFVAAKTRFREFTQDSFIRVKQLREKYEKALGMKLPDNLDPYLREELMHGRVRYRQQKIRETLVEIDKDIISTAKKLNVPDIEIKEGVEDYLFALHAPYFNNVHGDGAAGMTTEAARLMLHDIKALKSFPEIQRIAKNVKAMSDQILEVLVDGELITRELADTLKKTYPEYVPFNRIMDDETLGDIGTVLTSRGLDVRSSGLKRAKGSSRKVADIFVNIATNLNQAVLHAEKNRINLATLNLNRAFPELQFAKEVEPPIVPVANIEHKAWFDKNFEDKLVAFAKSLGADYKRTGQPGRIGGVFYPGQNLITRKFATPREVLAHETGHFLDKKFSLKENFYGKGIPAELKREMNLHMVRAGQSLGRQQDTAERFAHNFEWWLTHRDLAHKDIPLFSKRLESIIKKIPELKPILEIRPSPKNTLETMNELIFRRQKFLEGSNILHIMKNGKPVYLEIQDGALAQTFKGANIELMNSIEKISRYFVSIMGSLATRWNLGFAPRNILRDSTDMVVITSSKGGFRFGAEALSKQPQSINAITQFLRGKKTKDSMLYEQMIADGGTTGNLDFAVKEDIELDWKKIQKLNRSNPRKVATAILQGVENFNEIFENASRLSVYKTALDKGMSREQAASLAKNATVNFNKKGSGGVIINALYLFSNAAIQGTTNTLRAMRNPKIAAAVTTSIAASTYAVNNWNDSIDPNWREKVSKWDRLSNMVVVLPSNEGIKYITIPFAIGLKPIKAMADSLYDNISGKVSVPVAAQNISAAILNAYNPLGSSAFWFVPSVGQPFVELKSNINWKGKMIRPEWMKGLPGMEQYFPSTKETFSGRAAIGFSEGLHEMTGGYVSISPESILYAYEQLTSGTGRFLAQTVNTISGAWRGGLPEVRELPFLSSFYKNIPEDRLEQLSKSFSRSEIKTELQFMKPEERLEKIQEYLSSLPTAEERKSAAYALYKEGFSMKGTHTSDVAISAVGLYEELKKLPKDEAAAKFKDIARTEPKVASFIRKLSKQDKQTEEMKVLNEGNVKERAQKIYDKIMSLPKEERKSYYQLLIDSGVATPAVTKEIKELMK